MQSRRKYGGTKSEFSKESKRVVLINKSRFCLKMLAKESIANNFMYTNVCAFASAFVGYFFCTEKSNASNWENWNNSFREGFGEEIAVTETTNCRLWTKLSIWFPKNQQSSVFNTWNDTLFRWWKQKKKNIFFLNDSWPFMVVFCFLVIWYWNWTR